MRNLMRASSIIEGFKKYVIARVEYKMQGTGSAEGPGYIEAKCERKIGRATVTIERNYITNNNEKITVEVLKMNLLLAKMEDSLQSKPKVEVSKKIKERTEIIYKHKGFLRGEVEEFLVDVNDYNINYHLENNIVPGLLILETLLNKIEKQNIIITFRKPLYFEQEFDLEKGESGKIYGTIENEIIFEAKQKGEN